MLYYYYNLFYFFILTKPNNAIMSYSAQEKRK
jgi:hypothetical protein